MSTPPIDEQVCAAWRKIRAGSARRDYPLGMAVFVTPEGLRCTSAASRNMELFLFQYGEKALAGVYTQHSRQEWMAEDVAAVRGLGVA